MQASLAKKLARKFGEALLGTPGQRNALKNPPSGRRDKCEKLTMLNFKYEVLGVNFVVGFLAL